MKKITFKNIDMGHIDKELLRYMPAIGIGLFVVIFVVLTYFAVVPREDPQVLADGMGKLEDLDITFNIKLIKELIADETTSVGAIKGRNPFSD